MTTINLPPVPSGPLQTALQAAFQAITRAFNSSASSTEAQTRVLLADAANQVWAVSITTTGVVTTTTVSGKVRQV
jgi:hypothetical protein